MEGLGCGVASVCVPGTATTDSVPAALVQGYHGDGARRNRLGPSTPLHPRKIPRLLFALLTPGHLAAAATALADQLVPDRLDPALGDIRERAFGPWCDPVRNAAYWNSLAGRNVPIYICLGGSHFIAAHLRRHQRLDFRRPDRRQ